MSGSVSSSTGGQPSRFSHAHPLNAMSCGLMKDATASQGPRGARRGQLGEELDHLLGEDAVAHRAAVRLGRTVGLTADPTGEPVGIKAVGPLVGRHRLGNDVPGVVGGHQALVGARNQQVGVRDVPLAPVVRLVAAGPEPVAECGHRIGIEPAHGGVVRLLRHAIGVGPAVEGRVLAGEERRAARQAGGRARVVPMELEAPLPDGLARPQLLPPEAGQRLALVGRRVALLVRHDHENVRGEHPGKLHAG